MSKYLTLGEFLLYADRKGEVRLAAGIVVNIVEVDLGGREPTESFGSNQSQNTQATSLFLHKKIRSLRDLFNDSWLALKFVDFKEL